MDNTAVKNIFENMINQYIEQSVFQSISCYFGFDSSEYAKKAAETLNHAVQNTERGRISWNDQILQTVLRTGDKTLQQHYFLALDIKQPPPYLISNLIINNEPIENINTEEKYLNQCNDYVKKYTGYQSIHIAAATGQDWAVQNLLETQKDALGYTALHYAAEKDHTECYKILTLANLKKVINNSSFNLSLKLKDNKPLKIVFNDIIQQYALCLSRDSGTPVSVSRRVCISIHEQRAKLITRLSLEINQQKINEAKAALNDAVQHSKERDIHPNDPHLKDHLPIILRTGNPVLQKRYHPVLKNHPDITVTTSASYLKNRFVQTFQNYCNRLFFSCGSQRHTSQSFESTLTQFEACETVLSKEIGPNAVV